MVTLVALFLSALLQGATTRIDYVPFCEIVDHPEQYDQKSVLTAGIYSAGHGSA